MTNQLLRRSSGFLGCLALLFCPIYGSAQSASDYDLLVQQGKTQLQAGSAEKALSSGQAAININAGRWEGYALAGGALMNLKRYEAAADNLSEAIRNAPEAKQEALRDLRRQCLIAESGPPGANTPPRPATTTSQAEIVLWKTIENSDNQKEFSAYLQQYPNGAFAALARARISELAADHGEHAYLRGMDEANNKNYIEANASFQLGCDNGSVAACVELGREYDQGIGVGKDLVRAAELEQRACDNANAKGCSWLGVIYARGEGVPQDFGKAAQLWQMACEKNDLPSCNNLGFAYTNKDMGVAQDFSRAIALFQQACDGGQSTGCANLANMYSKGLGVAKNAAVTRQLRQKACSLGDKSECGS